MGMMLAGCMAFLGCNSKPEPPAAPTTLPTGSATITGTIRFVGSPPKMVDIPNAICAGTNRAIPEETVLVSSSGGIQNCIVYLKGITTGGGNTLAAPVLDQINCRYVPHVLAVMVGQPLIIRSSDATPHNVHLQTSVNPPANFAMVQPGQQTVTHFNYPEIFKVTCDVHPWMSAWVGVFSNPFFTVTDINGHFEIKNIPAGSYSLEIWHERLGTQEHSITISNRQTLEENFSYAPSVSGVGG